MIELIENFQLVRPLWLLAILPALVLAWFLLQSARRQHGWQQAISPELLPALLQAGEPVSQRRRWPILAVLLAWILCCLVLAGPSWKRIPTPVHDKEDAVILILDLSLSMLVEDQAPSRLVHARHKILDILEHRKEGQTALVVYSGDAHAVAPLTDDTDTIAALVPTLSPAIMPSLGSNPGAAIRRAIQLMKDATVNDARFLLITDDIHPDDIGEISDTIAGHSIDLAILGIGTSQGGPIPLPNGGFFKDKDGSIAVARLHRDRLDRLAVRTGGRFRNSSISDADWQYLLSESVLEENSSSIATAREFDAWHEEGPWMALLLLPFIALAFRRGWLLCLPLLWLAPIEQSHAFEWKDLWLTRDQQGQQAYDNGSAKTASELFQRGDWKGTAAFKTGDFDAAAEAFATGDNAVDHYNRGNSLARAGKLDDALEAYNEALKRNPDMEDAQVNREIVQALRDQIEEQQDQQEQDGDQQQDGNEQDQQSQNGDQNQEQNSNGDDQENQQDSGQRQSSEDAEEREQQDAAEAEAGEETDENGDMDSTAVAMDSELSDEEKQAMEQWLRQIPDDPGGLLKRKFLYQYQQRVREGREETPRTEY